MSSKEIGFVGVGSNEELNILVDWERSRGDLGF